jgi:iron complex outermembrane receptor protein
VVIAAVTAAACAVRLDAQTTTPPAPRLSQEIIVTGTIAPVPLEALSRSVTVVTRADVEQLGLTSVIEALRLVPGVDVRARGPRDVQSDFSIRGATFGQNLVLADGVRLNDTQSGHHNGEIPLPLVAIDRIEIVSGASSAAHGADALGGTINVISRRGRHLTTNVAAGQHGLVDAQVSTGGVLLPETWMLTGWASRSSGFTYDRDFAQGGGALRGSPARAWTIDIRHQRRAFGANGFYGNSPSKEWTDGTLASVAWQRAGGPWTSVVRTAVRNHGDHFRWDINRPGFAENRHRTMASELDAALTRALPGGALASVGASGSGDWIESSNLGDHHYRRVSGFAEVRTPVGDRTTVQAGIRVDDYSTFGRATSPSASVSSWVTSNLRLRASAGHAFRVPTFTELYYTDPANLGSPDLGAERGWSVDGGGDWSHRSWSGALSVFRRWDEDVIDWIRPTSTVRWRSVNVRDVTATGFEAALTRQWSGALLRLHYAGLSVDAPALTQESKYVNEYARHQSGGSLAVPLGAGLRASICVDHRHRRDGQSYDLVAARLSRAWGRQEVYVDVTNLLDERYHEVVGVEMPGRWVTVGVRIK